VKNLFEEGAFGGSEAVAGPSVEAITAHSTLGLMCPKAGSTPARATHLAADWG
jgi:hypothetical protein